MWLAGYYYYITSRVLKLIENLKVEKNIIRREPDLKKLSKKFQI